jgi:hypothetical protein
MTFLLWLYPAPWRRRYGGEVAEMLADRRFSLRIAVDLVAGAIDVWLHPSTTMAAAMAAGAAKSEERKTMLSRIARLDCRTAFGPSLSKADQWKASAVMVGCSLVLTALWMTAHIRVGDNTYIDSLSVLPFMIGMLASMRYTYLKNRSNGVQAVFIGGATALLVLFFLATGWLAAQI